MNNTAQQGLLCKVPINLEESIQEKQAEEKQDKCHDHKRYFLSTLIEKYSRTNKEVVVQLSSSSEGSRGKNHREEIFDEKSRKILKSSSFPTSLVPSNSLNNSRKPLEEDFLKRKYLTTNEQLANKLSTAANEGTEGKKSLAVIIDSPSKENYTQIVTDSTMSSRDSATRVRKSISYKNEMICNKVTLGFTQPRLKKRYVLNKHKWYTGTLSWSFRDPFRLFKSDQKFIIVKDILRQAFEKWSNSSGGALVFKDLSPLDRTIGSSNANFDVLFAKYAHGDKESFDGFGGIVAHSGYPLEGIIHFDGSEYWSIDGRNGLDLRYVALHEIGHALGLKHSKDPKAIMHPYYSDQLGKVIELGEDDVLGIRKLYGTS